MLYGSECIFSLFYLLLRFITVKITGVGKGASIEDRFYKSFINPLFLCCLYIITLAVQVEERRKMADIAATADST